MATISITHTPAEGTLADGLVRGDGTYEILLAHGFRWFRNLQMMGVKYSRDHAPKLGMIEAAIAALEAVGHDVEADIDTAPRDAADAEAARRDRLADRADALTAKADRRAAESDARQAAADRVFEGIPFGQPMLVDHYSYKSDRNRRERAWKNLEKSWALGREANQAAGRADTARRNAEAPINPRALMRKIDTLTADIRRDQRALNGEVAARNAAYGDTASPATGTYRAELLSRIAYAEEARRHAQAQIDEAKAAGAVIYGPADFDKAAVKAGRVHVKCWAGGSDGYAQVSRVNPKSVTVLRHPREGVTWTDTMPYDQVFAVRVDEAPQQLEDQPAPARPARKRTPAIVAEGDTRMEQLRWIVARQQAAVVGGERRIDLTTAQAMIAVYEACKPETQAKLDAGSLDGFLYVTGKAFAR